MPIYADIDRYGLILTALPHAVFLCRRAAAPNQTASMSSEPVSGAQEWMPCAPGGDLSGLFLRHAGARFCYMFLIGGIPDECF